LIPGGVKSPHAAARRAERSSRAIAIYIFKYRSIGRAAARLNKIIFQPYVVLEY
jgi:hypothetical protein